MLRCNFAKLTFTFRAAFFKSQRQQSGVDSTGRCNRANDRFWKRIAKFSRFRRSQKRLGFGGN